VVTVTTERDTYSATEPIVWGAPTTVINETVTIKDISDLFGEVDAGHGDRPERRHVHLHQRLCLGGLWRG
jgi:hypothetical protein